MVLQRMPRTAIGRGETETLVLVVKSHTRTSGVNIRSLLVLGLAGPLD
ncbi:MAG: hypothetical protein ACRDFS_03200 [Chloroflexota bacterium]